MGWDWDGGMRKEEPERPVFIQAGADVVTINAGLPPWGGMREVDIRSFDQAGGRNRQNGAPTQSLGNRPSDRGPSAELLSNCIEDVIGFQVISPFQGRTCGRRAVW